MSVLDTFICTRHAYVRHTTCITHFVKRIYTQLIYQFYLMKVKTGLIGLIAIYLNKYRYSSITICGRSLSVVNYDKYYKRFLMQWRHMFFPICQKQFCLMQIFCQGCSCMGFYVDIQNLKTKFPWRFQVGLIRVLRTLQENDFALVTFNGNVPYHFQSILQFFTLLQFFQK